MESSFSSDFGAKVRHYRRKMKLSQEQLAERADLHPTYVGQVERGEKNASLESIMKLSKGLDIPPALLFERLTYKPEPSEAQKAYDLIMSLPPEKQKIMLELMQKAIDLMQRDNAALTDHRLLHST